MNTILEQIKVKPKVAGSLLDTPKKAGDFIDHMSARIAFYFQTTLGFPVEAFAYEFENLDMVQQLNFCLDMVKKGYYYE